MKVPLFPLARLFTISLAVFHCLPVSADPAITPIAEPPVQEARPALKPQVIEAVEVKLPDRSVFYQRVAPPNPPPPRPPAPEPQPLSPAEQAAADTRAKKKFEVLMISATVYDRRVTELRWYVGAREYRAWSNVDFNFLAGQGEIETEDSVFMLLMAISNENAEAAAARKELPAAESFSAKRSEYLLEGDVKESPLPEALAPLDALHTYYDANRERLAEEYIRREAERIAREQWQKEHPPVPQDTVITFWPKKSRNYPTAGK